MTERLGTGSLKWEASPWGLGPTAAYPFWVADMDLPSPVEVQKALSHRAAHPYYGYTLAPEELLPQVCSWVEQRQKRHILPSQLSCAGGLMPSLAAAIRALTQEGDSIVVQPPVYQPFYSIIRDNNRKVLENPLIHGEGQYKMDLDHLESLAARGAKALLLCSPHNPVGRVWSREELKSLSEICSRHGLWVFSDEIHSDLVWTPFTSYLDGEKEEGEKSVAFFGPNKTFNLAGLPISFVQSTSRKIKKSIEKEMGAMGFHLPSIFAAQGALAAYTYGHQWLDELLGDLAQRKKELALGLGPDWPFEEVQGTYLAWIKIPYGFLSKASLEDSDALARLLDKDWGLRLSPGTWFQKGGRERLRWNFATSPGLLDQGIKTFQKAILKIGK